MNTTKTTVHSDDGSNYDEEDKNFTGSTFQIPSMDHVEQSSLSDNGINESDGDNGDNNPFRIPTDEEVFLMKDVEKKQKQLERVKLAKLPIHEKTTFTTRFAVKRYRDASDGGFPEKYNSARLPLIHNTSAGHTSTGMYKENIADLLAKKRKMFLIQMSIDTKKFEIAKLEEKAAEKEKKIEQEERTLMRDVQRFDDFLTENDIRAVEAINMANEENRLKEGKKKDVQKLNAKIAAVNNEIAKLDDQLENCKRYKNFLDKLTPKEWMEQQQQQQNEKQREHEKSMQQRNPKNEEESKRVTIGKTTTSNIQSGRPRRVSDARSTKSDSSTRRSREQKTQQSPQPRVEEIWKREREEIEQLLKDMPEMYFKEPEDLLNIFAELEEENLFLIQNTQDIEEQLEDLKRVYRETKEKREREADGLKSQIQNLTEEMERERSEIEMIKSQSGHTDDDFNVDLLEKLSDEIRKVYTEIGFGSTTSQLKPLQMLTDIESKFESLLSFVNTLDDKWVMQVEREQERMRRKKKFELRSQQLNQQERRRRERTRTDTGAVEKRQGKPLMFRSPLPAERRRRGRKDGKVANNEQQGSTQKSEAEALFA